MDDAPIALRPLGSRLFGGATIGLIAFLAVGLIAKSVMRMIGPEPPRSGEAAPTFVLNDIDGVSMSLSELRGRVVLLDFGTMTCVGCVGATSKLNRLHSRLAGRGLSVLSINQDDQDAAAVAAFIDRRSITYPVLLDDGAVADEYGMYAFPAAILIDRDGTIRAIHVGAVTEARLDAEIALLLDP